MSVDLVNSLVKCNVESCDFRVVCPHGLPHLIKVVGLDKYCTDERECSLSKDFDNDKYPSVKCVEVCQTHQI